MRKAASENVTQASGELGFRSACKNGCYDRRLAVHHEPYWDKRQHSRFRCMRAPCSCCGRWYLLRTPQSAGSAHNGRLIASARDNVRFTLAVSVSLFPRACGGHDRGQELRIRHSVRRISPYLPTDQQKRTYRQLDPMMSRYWQRYSSRQSKRLEWNSKVLCEVLPPPRRESFRYAQYSSGSQEASLPGPPNSGR